MNENVVEPINQTVTEEVKQPLYFSRFLMSKELFYDFGSVFYNRTKKGFFAFLCFTVCLIAVNILTREYEILISYCVFLSIMMPFIYFRTKKAITIGYERAVISAGKESTLNYELFDDKIVSDLDGQKREFFYHQITQLYETKEFILLHLKHNVFVTVNKGNLSASADEVKAFILYKCTHVKNKKFINCSNDKELSVLLLSALVTISVIGAVIAIILMCNAPV